MASTNYTSVIEKLYVAYLARPADQPGLQYWDAVLTANHGDTRPLMAAFAQAGEYKALVAGMDAYHVVNVAYQNMFGRLPDVAGLNYWGQALISGVVSVDKFMDAVAHGAQGSDVAILNNRVTAASALSGEMISVDAILAYSGTSANAAARHFLSTIDSDASLAAALVPATLHASLMGMFGYCGPAPTPAHAPVAPIAADPIILVGQADALPLP